MHTISDKLKMMRELLNYSQQGLASEIDLPQSTYSRVENHKDIPAPKHLKKIVDFYGITMGELTDSPYNELREKVSKNLLNNRSGRK